MLGSWSMEGYEHEDSKSIRGDKFCGLLLDMVNQEDLTEERVQRWVAQLKEEGILEGASSSTTPAVAAEIINGEPDVATASASTEEDRLARLEEENAALRKMLDESSELLDQSIASHSSGGFTPHYNPVTGKTMWTSPDGRKSYVTVDSATKLNP